jgi:hypothetical protein
MVPLVDPVGSLRAPEGYKQAEKLYRPDVISTNNKDKVCLLLDVAIPSDRKVKGPIHDQSCCATLRVVQLIDRVWC